MAAVDSLPQLHSLEWELTAFGLTDATPLTWEECLNRRTELEEARNVNEAAALQALQSGVRLPPAGGTGAPKSLRDLHLKFEDTWLGRRNAGPAELTHKLGLPSWVAGAVHLEELAVQGAGEVVEAALNAAAPPGAVTSAIEDS